jgi:hypothetical protein
MNERIRELAEQATLAVTKPDGHYIVQAWQAKFAELIVKECVEVMRLVPYKTDREFGDEVIYQDAVKKHFGVEE